MDISPGTVIKVLNLTKSHPNRRTKSDCSWQRKCGEIAFRSSSLPTLIKTICTTISASIRFPFLTGRNTTIPKQSRENSVKYPTGSAGNTAYRLSKIPHKAPSRQVWLDEKSGKPTRYNVYREDVKEAINFSRRPYYIWRNICGGKGILPTLLASIGRYDCRSTSILQGWTRWMKDGRLKISKGQWAFTLPSETAGRWSPIRSKCRRACGTGFQPFQKTSHIYPAISALLLSVRRPAEENHLPALQAPISKRI